MLRPQLAAPDELLRDVVEDLAPGRELEFAVGICHAPMRLVESLVIVTDAGRLPWLVKGLEIEDVNVPVQQATDC